MPSPQQQTPAKVWVIADLLSDLAAQEWAQKPVTQSNLRDAIVSLNTSLNTFRPETYGAKGDNATNDTDAFAAMSLAVNAAGGGIIELRPTATYIVGKQDFAGQAGLGYAYRPRDIIKITGCTRPVIIEGRGAKLKAAAGLKYGQFDATTGLAAFAGLPYVGENKANAYTMIWLTLNSAKLVVRNLELDGNDANITLGGLWGDTGRQTTANGWTSDQNSGGVVFENVYSHHHCLDGEQISYGFTGSGGVTETSQKTPHLLIECTSEYNGRQGLSWVGGIGLTCISCKFNHTGRGAVVSAPTAGLDIEPTAVCRDGLFIECEFVNNAGVGAIEDGGDGRDMTFQRCTFWGVSNFAIWPNGRRWKFRDCRIYGSVVNCFNALYPNASGDGVQFDGCEFDDKLWSDGNIYQKNLAANPLLNIPSANGAKFRQCTFRAYYHALMTVGGADFEKCFFEFGFAGEADKAAIMTAAVNTTFRDCKWKDLIVGIPTNGYFINAPAASFQGRNFLDSTGALASVKWDNWDPSAAIGAGYVGNKGDTSGPASVFKDHGNTGVAVTLTWGQSEKVHIWNTPITANRAVALDTTVAERGAFFKIIRTAAATGAFTVDVGTGPLKSLTAGQWCEVTYNGAAWVLTAFGSL